MSVSLLIGDCRERLKELPDASVHCCVTSPPYFGLRDYGTAQWDGGSPECDHRVGRATRGGYEGTKQSTSAGSAPAGEAIKHGGQCPHCGATRIDRQMGLEPTPDEFVAGMVEVFREVRRVLRDDGTLWLNIGDSYAGSWGAQGRQGESGQMATRSVSKVRGRANISAAQIAAHPQSTSRTGSIPKGSGLKPKDLIGIPWMLAFALRADGWYLRQDIIWSKPNPMPESVRDRCTKAHEYLFLLSKGPRYYYDAEAIAEPVALSTIGRLKQDIEAQSGSERAHGSIGKVMKAKAPRFGGNKYGSSDAEEHRTKSGNAYEVSETGNRNKRSVWEVATQPFSEAHFATYPPALIEPCILAGCPKGGTVLDPFGGAGTTGLVADRLGRDAILVELNPEYAAIAERRLNADAPLFAEVKAA